jgi:hypothetical protein
MVLFDHDWRRRRKAGRKFLSEFSPMTQFAPEDVFIVGFPKSGNTWFQDLVMSVMYGVSPAYAPPTLAQELVPDVHWKPFYRRHATPMFFKSHHLPRPEYKRVVYLIRDGRDAMVSYFHYIKALEGTADFMELVKTARDLPCKWHVHVESWLANPFSAEMLVIKYEDLKSDTAAELERFCKFAGVERDYAFLETAARETRFEKMQRKEMRLGVGNPGWPKDKLFRRRGVVGSYKDEMSPEVQAAFTAEAGEMLRKVGYEPAVGSLTENLLVSAPMHKRAA